MSAGPNRRAQERRSSPRFSLDVPVLLASERGWGIARARDLSRGGIAIVGSNARALAGLGITNLYFELPKLVGIEAEAQLVWVADSECAFEFRGCSHDAQVALRAWLHACVLRTVRSGKAPRCEVSARGVKG